MICSSRSTTGHVAPWEYSPILYYQYFTNISISEFTHCWNWKFLSWHILVFLIPSIQITAFLRFTGLAVSELYKRIQSMIRPCLFCTCICSDLFHTMIYPMCKYNNKCQSNNTHTHIGHIYVITINIYWKVINLPKMI